MFLYSASRKYNDYLTLSQISNLDFSFSFLFMYLFIFFIQNNKSAVHIENLDFDFHLQLCNTSQPEQSLRK